MNCYFNKVYRSLEMPEIIDIKNTEYTGFLDICYVKDSIMDGKDMISDVCEDKIKIISKQFNNKTSSLNNTYLTINSIYKFDMKQSNDRHCILFANIKQYFERGSYEFKIVFPLLRNINKLIATEITIEINKERYILKRLSDTEVFYNQIVLKKSYDVLEIKV